MARRHDPILTFSSGSKERLKISKLMSKELCKSPIGTNILHVGLHRAVQQSHASVIITRVRKSFAYNSLRSRCFQHTLSVSLFYSQYFINSYFLNQTSYFDKVYDKCFIMVYIISFLISNICVDAQIDEVIKCHVVCFKGVFSKLCVCQTKSLTEVQLGVQLVKYNTCLKLQ